MSPNFRKNTKPTVHGFDQFVYALIPPQWKLLLSSTFPVASFFGEIEIFRFLPKTMDYGFDQNRPNFDISKTSHKGYHTKAHLKRSRIV